MLGALQTVSSAQHLTGVLTIVTMLLAWTRLQSVALRLKAREQESRWASTLRDLVNLVLVSTLWAGYRLTGLPGPAAFLFAGTIAILLDVLRHAAPAEQRRVRLTVWAVMPLGALLAIFPAAALAEAGQLVDGLLHRS